MAHIVAFTPFSRSALRSSGRTQQIVQATYVMYINNVIEHIRSVKLPDAVRSRCSGTTSRMRLGLNDDAAHSRCASARVHKPHSGLGRVRNRRTKSTLMRSTHRTSCAQACEQGRPNVGMVKSTSRGRQVHRKRRASCCSLVEQPEWIRCIEIRAYPILAYELAGCAQGAVMHHS